MLMKKMIKSKYFCNSKNWPRRLPKIKIINKKIISQVKLYLKKNYSYYFNIILTNDFEMVKLNEKYKNKKTSTDVLTFVNYVKNKKFANIRFCDIFFSFDTIKKDANKNDIDFYDHYTHLLLHSFLHINGYNHVKLSDFIKMQKIEIKVLKKLGINNPYIKYE